MNMPWTDGVAIACAGATLCCLLVSSLSDLARRVIPNQAALGVLGAGIVHRSLAGVEAVGLSLGIALGLFGLMVLLHGRGLIGGGDVKLIAAMSAGLSPVGTLRFLVAMAIAGAGLAGLHLVLRHLPEGARSNRGLALPRRVLAVERWRIRRKGSLPYGIAIAVGGAWVMLTGSGG